MSRSREEGRRGEERRTKAERVSWDEALDWEKEEEEEEEEKRHLHNNNIDPSTNILFEKKKLIGIYEYVPPLPSQAAQIDG